MTSSRYLLCSLLVDAGTPALELLLELCRGSLKSFVSLSAPTSCTDV